VGGSETRKIEGKNADDAVVQPMQLKASRVTRRHRLRPHLALHPNTVSLLCVQKAICRPKLRTADDISPTRSSNRPVFSDPTLINRDSCRLCRFLISAQPRSDAPRGESRRNPYTHPFRV